MFKLKYIVLLCLGLYGCSALIPTYKSIGEDQFFPKKPKFTIKPLGSYERTGLDFNAIYYVRDEVQGDKDQDVYISYDYYRFWPDGRVINKTSESRLPSRSEVENFSGGYLGYYQVDGSELKMEFFFPYSVTLNWDYIRIYSTIEEDRIINLTSETKYHETKYRTAYVKKNFGQLVNLPNW